MNDSKPNLYLSSAISLRNDQGILLTELLGGSAFARTTADEAAAPTPAPSLGREIGTLIEIAGSGGQVLFEPDAIASYAGNSDPVLVSAGSVGTKIKVRVGG